MSTERFKNVTSFVINLLNNKTIILFSLAEYRLIRRYSARFRRIIVKYQEQWAPDSIADKSVSCVYICFFFLFIIATVIYFTAFLLFLFKSVISALWAALFV